MLTIRARRVTAAVSCALAAVGVAKAEVTGALPLDTTQSTLTQALKDYALTFDRTIIFTESLVAGMKASSLKGNYTADAALAQLLKGTGLVAERNSVGAVVIRKEGEGKPTAEAVAMGPAAFRLAQAESSTAAQAGGSSSETVGTGP
jgi:hypothetical protein